MKLRLGIVAKLTLIFVLFAAGLLTGLGLLAYNSGRASLQAATTAGLLSTALEKQASLNNWVSERQGGVADLANYPHVVDEAAALVSAAPGSPEAQAAHDALVRDLNPVAGSGRGYLELMLLDPTSGKVLAATDPTEEGKYHEDLPYFSQGKTGPYVQNLYFSVAFQAPAMTASAPIRSVDGRLLGVLAGQMNLDEMNAIISRRSGLQQTDDALLVTPSNLLATQPRFMGEPAVLQRGVHTEGVNRCLAHNSGVLLFADYRGVPVIGVYRWLPERQLCLIVKVDQAEAFAPARALGATILFTGLLALLAAGALSVWLARTITRPILALQAGAARLGQGDLEYQVKVHSRDELGQLAGAFNRMALSLTARAQENTQLLDSLRQSHAELEQGVQERTADLAHANETLVAEMAERQLARAALGKSEESYRTLFEQATDGIFIADPQGRYIDVNSSGCQMLGYTREEILQLTMADLVAPADQAQSPLRLPELHMGQSVMSERQMICSDGRLLSVEISGKRLPDGRIQGIVRDITERKRAEAALRDSEARFRSVLDSMLEGCQIMGFDWRYLYLNDTADVHNRRPKEELLGHAYTEMWPGIETTNVYAVIRQCMDERTPHRLENEFVFPDGALGWFELSIQPMPEGVFILSNDITERKRAEAALRQSEQRFSVMFEKAPFAATLSKLPDGVAVDVNQAWVKMSGYSKPELLGRTTLELNINPDVEERARVTAELRARGSVRDQELTLRMKSGETRTMSVNIDLVEIGGQTYVLNTAQDITERKRAEAELRDLYARLRFYVDANMIGVVRENELGKLMEVNDYYLNLLGFTRQEYEAGLVDWKDRTPPEHLPANSRAIAELKERGVCAPYEKEYYRKDGSRVWVYLSNALMPDGTIAAYVLDITERKQAEAALMRQREDLARSNAELEQFAYVASHDLQEPLRMVSSYVKLLAQRYQGQLDPKADKYIGYAVEGATRMQALINDLLAYSRVGTRGRPLAPTSCDQALDRALANLEIAIRESGAVVAREPLPTLPGDDVHLVQLFQNLVGNALKFHRPDVPARVEIGARRQNGEWVFAVRDNGIGIAPQHAERIFVIFQRLHSREEYPGTGMGLAICKKIVERHNGRIWVESEPNQGSTFYFTLPETGGH